MKKLILLIAVLFSFQLVLAQGWMQNLPDEARDNPDFNQVVKAFNDYAAAYETGKVPGEKQFRRTEWFMKTRLDKDGFIPREIYWNEARKARMENKSGYKSYGNWENLGPYVTPTSWTLGGRGGSGRIDCITFHPSDPDIFYVGTPTGGCWKTTDGGESWECLTDDLPTLGVSDIEIDPTNTDILYLATGTRDAWWETFSVGVLKSENGGQDWEETGLSFNVTQQNQVNELLMNPDDHLELIAASTNGIYKTYDGGEEWTLVRPGNYKDLEYKPGDFSVIYTTSFSYSGPSYFLKSTDYGQTFNSVSMGFSQSNVSRTTLCTTPADPDVVYAICADRYSQGFYGVYRSDDAGDSWIHVSEDTPYNLLGWNSNGMDQGGQGFYDLSIAVSPTNADVIYTGGVNIWKSTDGGFNYSLHAHWLGNGGVDYVHADIHMLTFNPNNNTLFVGCDGGIYKLLDDGEDYLDLSDGLVIYQAYRLGLYEPHEDVAIISPQDNGTTLFEGDQFSEILLAEACDNFYAWDDPLNMYYGGYGAGLVRSYDGGINAQSIQPPGEPTTRFLPPFEKHPTDPQIIYGAYTDAWISYNQGDDWENLTDGLSGGTYYSTLKVAPSNPDYIYLSNGIQLWMTTDNGEHWINISSGLGSGTVITDVCISYDNPEQIWVTHGGFNAISKVYKSINGGENYENITSNLPNLSVNCALYQKNTDNAVYIGTDVGVYYINDDYDEWINYSEGLPNVIVLELEINYTQQKIKAATYGRGLWQADLFNPYVNIPEKMANDGLVVFPNPSTGEVNIGFEEDITEPLSITVYNTSSQIVDKYSFTHTISPIQLNLTSLNRGVYFIQINGMNKFHIKKLIIH